VWNAFWIMLWMEHQNIQEDIEFNVIFSCFLVPDITCNTTSILAARGIPVINDFFLAHVENGTYRTERKMRFSRLKISMLVPHPTMTENKQHCL
jgi:hypothetical protein